MPAALVSVEAISRTHSYTSDQIAQPIEAVVNCRSIVALDKACLREAGTDYPSADNIQTWARTAMEDAGTGQSKPICTRYRRSGYKRTRSGCMTCRQRKKKCDETRPTCKFLDSIMIFSVDCMPMQAIIADSTTFNVSQPSKSDARRIQRLWFH